MTKQPARGILRKVPKGMYTRSQVAQSLGKSKDTIRRWHDNGTYVSRHCQTFGNLKVWLYDDADLAAMRVIARDLTPGRKPGIQKD